jgi:predicted naringenin-chalcone synthase
MSSASILFVLAEILKQSAGGDEGKVCAVAFGPGLTVEMALFSALPALSVSPGDRAGGARTAIKVW